jgi:hypothetical protein
MLFGKGSWTGRWITLGAFWMDSRGAGHLNVTRRFGTIWLLVGLFSIQEMEEKKH